MGLKILNTFTPNSVFEKTKLRYTWKAQVTYKALFKTRYAHINIYTNTYTHKYIYTSKILVK